MQESTRRSHSGRLLLVFTGGVSPDPTPLRSPLSSWNAEEEEAPPAAEAAEQHAGLASAASVEPPWRAYADRLQRPPRPWSTAAQQQQQQAPGAGAGTPRTPRPGSHQEEEGEAGAFLNLAPVMNRAPLSVRRFTPAARVHRLFLSLSLRHLCVIDRSNAAVGIITRQDLVHAGHAQVGRQGGGLCCCPWHR